MVNLGLKDAGYEYVNGTWTSLDGEDIWTKFHSR